MVDHERIFSAIASYVGKHANVELRNDMQAGTMTVVFRSGVPADGEVVALKIFGTRNVEISVSPAVDWRNFRRTAALYASALDLLDCFHLIEVEPADSAESESGQGGLRIARRATQR
jgi:hypothetical protein